LRFFWLWWRRLRPYLYFCRKANKLSTCGSCLQNALVPSLWTDMRRPTFEGRYENARYEKVARVRDESSAFYVSICTFVPVQQVTCVSLWSDISRPRVSATNANTWPSETEGYSHTTLPENEKKENVIFLFFFAEGYSPHDLA
jgi:hypothetical protein